MEYKINDVGISKIWVDTHVTPLVYVYVLVLKYTCTGQLSLTSHGYMCMYRLHTKGEVCGTRLLLGNQARGVQPACTMTTQNSKIRLINSIALKSRLIT